MQRSPKSDAPSVSTLAQKRRTLLDRYPWLMYVLPLAVFMLVGAWEPKPQAAEGAQSWLAIPYAYYPAVYTLKIALTLVAMWFVLPGYRAFPLRITWWSILFGVAGVVVWVGLCELQLEQRWLPRVGLGWLVDSGTRSAYNPLEELEACAAACAWAFLAVRFFGLAMVVPVIEEFLLRGFLMRFVMESDWQKVPFGQVNRAAILVGSLFPVLTHPAEILAAVAWFSLITVLMVKTKRIWDCVVAHAVTNLLLGVYVLLSGQWHLM